MLLATLVTTIKDSLGSSSPPLMIKLNVKTIDGTPPETKSTPRSLLLRETLLPWVNFDNLISNTIDSNQLDIKMKVAKYIDLIATAF